ncbi:helix-turn-helix domain-containing protein [Pseudonocardia phyllosphaerae]|uniref:helix-turn-helix domain-containing protein n=1 Tax=Pseudonocardia phyllosphaerae TaxID=3390502 RepID=UPI00397E12D4
MPGEKKPQGDTPSAETSERVGQAAVDHVGQVVGHAQQAVGNAVEDIGSYIRAQREAAQVSMRQLARTAGVSNPYLSQVERGLRKPSAEILQQIARGLRISAEALYVRAGILEERPAGRVTDAVLTDPDLNERQKRVLLDVYESFRRENGLPIGTDAVSTGPTSTEEPSNETRK